ncbi:MAG: flagellar biosynthetic protein FliO [Planctomycetota bacterium]|nr:flagellar biosynthetic protein FliO [Planctomycetota bacterium]
MSALSLPVLALLDTLQEGTPTAAEGMPGLDMTRYALVCIGLVVAILLLGWGFKRFLSGNLRLRASQRSMKVVDMLPLGGKRQLAVVQCYDRTFVLGLGEREVNLVTELDVDEDVEGRLPGREQEPKQAGPTPRFGGILQSALERWSPPKDGQSPSRRGPAASVELTPQAAKAPGPIHKESESPAPSGGLGRGLIG